MKICILTDAWKPVWGGGQTHIWEVSQRLIKNYGYQVDIVVPNLADSSGVISVGPGFVFPNIFGRIAFIFSAFWFCLTHSYAIYHSHSYSTSLFLPLLKLKGKVFWTVHGRGVDVLGGGILNKTGIFKILERLALKLPVKQIPLVSGVDVKKFDAVKVKKNPKIFKILWVGRINDPVKGVPFLKEAVKKIKQKNIELSLVSNKYGDDLIKEYKSSDLFVLPSLSEGFPITILEAMAAKLPVVATAVGAVPEIVSDNKSGYIVPPGNVLALEQAIVRAINNSQLRLMGERGYRKVREMYTWDDVARATKKIYET